MMVMVCQSLFPKGSQHSLHPAATHRERASWPRPLRPPWLTRPTPRAAPEALVPLSACPPALQAGSPIFWGCCGTVCGSRPTSHTHATGTSCHFANVNVLLQLWVWTRCKVVRVVVGVVWRGVLRSSHRQSALEKSVCDGDTIGIHRSGTADRAGSITPKTSSPCRLGFDAPGAPVANAPAPG